MTQHGGNIFFYNYYVSKKIICPCGADNLLKTKKEDDMNLSLRPPENLSVFESCLM